MNIIDLYLAQLDREAALSRRALERVPEGRADWKPHEKSMPLGYLSNLVAVMPRWVAMAILQDELDLSPPGGGGFKPPVTDTRAKLLAAHDDSVAQASTALRGTTDAFL